MKLLFKHLFFSLFRKNLFKSFVIIFLVITTIILCFPIFQIQFDLKQKESKLVAIENKFDKYYKLYKHKDFLKLQRNDVFDDSIFATQPSNQKWKKFYPKESLANYIHNNLVPNLVANNPKIVENFQYFLMHDANFYSVAEKTNYSLRTANFCNENQQKLGKIHITKGIKPDCFLSFSWKKTPSPQKESPSKKTIVVDAVVNAKYATLNEIAIGDTIQISNEIILKIVGLGLTSSALSLGFFDLAKIKNSLNDDKLSTINAQKYLGFFYITHQAFWIMKQNELFFNYDNLFYFYSSGNQATKELLNQALLTQIKKDLNYRPEVFVYNFDPASGLKPSISGWIVLSLVVFVSFAVFFLAFFLCLLGNKNLKSKSSMIGFLNNLGFSKQKIANKYFQFYFWPLCLIVFVSYFLSFFFYDYLFTINQESYYFNLDYQPFNYLAFLIIFFLFAFLPAFSLFLYICFKLNNKSGKWLNPYILAGTQLEKPFYHNFFFWKKRDAKKSFFTFPIWIKLGLNFFWENFWKKILFIFFLFFLLSSIFFVFFFRIGTDNFLNKQWNFLQSDVKSFTKFKHSLFFNPLTENILSDYKFQVYKKEDYSTLQSLDDFQAIKDKTFDAKCLDENTTKARNKCILDFFKGELQKLKIGEKEVQNAKIKEYMQKFEFESIYFNVVPYDAKEDIPVLVLDVDFKKIEENVEIERDQQKGKLYFLSPGWENFFQVDRLAEKLPGFSFYQSSEDGQSFQTKTIGTNPDGVPYILVPYYYKELGYQLGDFLNFTFFLDWTVDTKSEERNFQIAGFLEDGLLYQNLFFTDHKNFNILHNLEKEDNITQFSSQEGVVFNYLFSKNNEKYIKRYAILDTTFFLQTLEDLINNDDVDLNQIDFKQIIDFKKVSLVNAESLLIADFNDILQYYFEVCQLYLILLLVFIIFFSALCLFLLIAFWFDDENFFFSLLKTFGLKWIKSFAFFFSLFSLIILITAILSFVFNLALLQFFINLFVEKNIFFFVFPFWEYFGYFVAFITLLFFFCLINSYFFFQKVSKISFAKKL